MSRRAMAMVMFALCFLSEQLRAELQENQCLQTTRAYSLDLLMCGQRKPARAKMCSAVNISHTSTDRATKAVSVLAQESVDWIADRLFLPQVPLLITFDRTVIQLQITLHAICLQPVHTVARICMLALFLLEAEQAAESFRPGLS